MKKKSSKNYASINEIQNNLKKFLFIVSEGNEIIVTKSGKSVAKLIPFKEAPPKKFKLPNFAARLKEIFPNGPMNGLTVAEVIRASRD